MRNAESLSLLLLTIAGCEPEAPGSTRSPGGDSAGLEEGGLVLSGLRAERSEAVPLVWTLDWQTNTPSLGRVEVLQDGERLFTTGPSGDPATEHHVSVVGLKSLSTYRARALAIGDDGETVSSELVTLETLGLPSWLPALTVTQQGDGPPDGYFLTPVYLGDPGSEASGVVIFDGDGDVVWYFEVDNIDTIQAVLSQDGRQILHLTDEGLIWRALDGTEVRRHEARRMHHSFQELSNGTVGTLWSTGYTRDGELWLDNLIVEVLPDGSTVELWLASDHVDELGIDLDDWVDIKKFGHANSLEYLPDQDAWLLGLSEWGVLVAVSRATGETLWSVNTRGGGTLDYAGSDPWTMHHVVDIVDEETLLVYVNMTTASNCARVLAIQLDHGANEATVTNTFTGQDDTCHGTFALGDVQRLDGGETVVTWSTNGQIEMVNPAEETVWKLETPFGYAFGYGQWITSLWDD